MDGSKKVISFVSWNRSVMDLLQRLVIVPLQADRLSSIILEEILVHLGIHFHLQNDKCSGSWDSEAQIMMLLLPCFSIGMMMTTIQLLFQLSKNNLPRSLVDRQAALWWTLWMFTLPVNIFKPLAFFLLFFCCSWLNRKMLFMINSAVLKVLLKVALKFQQNPKSNIRHFLWIKNKSVFIFWDQLLNMGTMLQTGNNDGVSLLRFAGAQQMAHPSLCPVGKCETCQTTQ